MPLSFQAMCWLDFACNVLVGLAGPVTLVK